MQIANGIALVTGANRGVGKVYVEELLKRGASKVYAAARSPESLTDVFNDPRVQPLKLDVTNAEDIRAAVDAASDVTILINNAGALSFGGALDVGAEAVARDMAVNFSGLHDVTRAFAPVIAGNGGGKVVNMLSLLSFLAAPGFSAYNASKAAAWSMSMSLRAYLAPKGISVLNAFPAGIDTEMLAGVDAPKDSPATVVREVLDAVEADIEDVYPGAAADVFSAWRESPKDVERGFAAMM